MNNNKMSSPNADTSKNQSKEVCQFMNSNHAARLHALALQHVQSSASRSYKTKVSYVKLSTVSVDKFTLSYVECQSDSMCMMKSADICFDPPLKSVLDAPSRMLQLSVKAMTPKWLWLLTEPAPLLVSIVMLLLGYVSFVMGNNELQSAVQRAPLSSKILTAIFGSVGAFYSAIRASFYLAVCLHTLEAFYVAFKMKTKFNLPVVSISNWFLLVCCVGYPVTSKALGYIKIDDEQKNGKQA